MKNYLPVRREDRNILIKTGRESGGLNRLQSTVPHQVGAVQFGDDANVA